MLDDPFHERQAFSSFFSSSFSFFSLPFLKGLVRCRLFAMIIIKDPNSWGELEELLSIAGGIGEKKKKMGWRKMWKSLTIANGNESVYEDERGCLLLANHLRV